MSTPLTLALLVVAVGQWLACVVWVMVRPARQPLFLASTTLLAVVMLLLVTGGGGVTPVGGPAPRATAAGACASVERGMSAARLRQMLGEPASIVNDEDTQGPGSEAWVYPDARCVVRLLDGKARAVDFQ